MNSEPAAPTTRAEWLTAAGLIAAGASMMLLKGVIRASTAADLSLVPWFGFGATSGLALSARAIIHGGTRTFATGLATWVGAGGFVAATVALAYLFTGTIPESEAAPAAVGISYAVMAAGAFLALAILGVVIARRRLLDGRWRWVPIGAIAVQLPIFMVAEAVGDALGRDTVADGLGIALTGAAWVLLAYALTRQPTAPAPSTPAPGGNQRALSTPPTEGS